MKTKIAKVVKSVLSCKLRATCYQLRAASLKVIYKAPLFYFSQIKRKVISSVAATSRSQIEHALTISVAYINRFRVKPGMTALTSLTTLTRHPGLDPGSLCVSGLALAPRSFLLLLP